MDFIDYLQDNFGFDEVEGGGQLKLQGHCPFCLENRDDLRVYVSKKTKMGFCFHCSTGFGPTKFIMAAEGCDKKKALDILNSGEEGFIREDAEEEAQQSLVWPSMLPIPDSEAASEYLNKRGIPESVWRHFRLYYSLDNVVIGSRTFYTKSRIIIPIHDAEGTAIAWQARDITGKARTKYMSPPGWNSNEILYNAWSVPYNPDYLVISEGVFDVFGWWRAGIKNCVCTFGKKIGDAQVDLLRGISPKIIFIAWDSDADLLKYEFMEKYGWLWEIRFVDMGGKDADEMDRAELLHRTAKARPYSWNDKIHSALL